MKRLISLTILIILALLVLPSILFTVSEKQYALVFKFGQWQRTVSSPGLHIKLPAPFENIVYLDKRIQTIESSDTERIQTSEKKNLIIDSYIKWRISNPLQYYVSFGASGSAAQNRLGALIRDALNASVNTRTVRAVISQERDVVMNEIIHNMEARAKPFGIQVVDVRLKRIEFSTEVSDSVYARMRAERKQEANNLRATGAAESERIRAQADRKAQEILAKATAEAQKIRGEGDAQAANIYNQSYGKDPAFYRFYSSMKAYQNIFSKHQNTIVIDPNNQFFQLFNSKQKAEKKTTSE